jgi:hypothetical protein
MTSTIMYHLSTGFESSKSRAVVQLALNAAFDMSCSFKLFTSVFLFIGPFPVQLLSSHQTRNITNDDNY